MSPTPKSQLPARPGSTTAGDRTIAPTRRAKLAQFGIVGAIGFAADGGTMLLLSSALALSALWVRPLSFAFAVTLTWWMNRHFTFSHAKSKDSLTEWWRYVATNSAGAAINLAVFYLAVLACPQLAFQPLLTLAIASGAAMVFNYQMAQRVVFRSTDSVERSASSPAPD